MPVKARYDKLEPAVRAAFDLPAMTRIAVGPAWTTIGRRRPEGAARAVRRFTIATYASRFDGWSGERFEVDPATETRGENRIVHSTLVRPKGDPIVLNYLVHATDDGWKATDVYLNGTISELATRRSEFGTLLKSGGAGRAGRQPAASAPTSCCSRPDGVSAAGRRRGAPGCAGSGGVVSRAGIDQIVGRARRRAPRAAWPAGSVATTLRRYA